MTVEEINHIKETLIEKITRANPGILKTYPVEELINRINKQSSNRGYAYINKETENFNQSLIQDTLNNKHIIGIYYNLVLLTLIINSREKIQTTEYPEIVIEEYYKKFDRIIRKILNWTDNIIYQPLNNDKFLKDLALCRQRMIPVGPQYFEITKLSRRFLLTGGLHQFFIRLFYIARLGGFAPYYKLSTNQLDPDLIAQFNPEGWEKLLVCAKELILKNKEIKGIIGNSWFFDPQLELVDKEIAYIRKKFLNLGTKFYLHRMDSHVVKDAIFLSKKRERLYLDKIYKPRNYLVVLSRQNLLKFYHSKSL